MEAAALLETLFQLPVEFGIPDLLYYEEIAPGSPDLESFGLKVMEVRGEYIAYAVSLPERYNHVLPAKNGAKPSHNDYLALALAKQEDCTLASGDANLRIVAAKEQIEITDTIGILCALVESQLLSTNEALLALDRMKNAKRRLPWDEAKKRLNAIQ